MKNNWSKLISEHEKIEEELSDQISSIEKSKKIQVRNLEPVIENLRDKLLMNLK